MGATRIVLEVDRFVSAFVVDEERSRFIVEIVEFEEAQGRLENGVLGRGVVWGFERIAVRKGYE